jgi:hypothetical protein
MRIFKPLPILPHFKAFHNLFFAIPVLDRNPYHCLSQLPLYWESPTFSKTGSKNC